MNIPYVSRFVMFAHVSTTRFLWYPRESLAPRKLAIRLRQFIHEVFNNCVCVCVCVCTVGRVPVRVRGRMDGRALRGVGGGGGGGGARGAVRGAALPQRGLVSRGRGGGGPAVRVPRRVRGRQLRAAARLPRRLLSAPPGQYTNIPTLLCARFLYNRNAIYTSFYIISLVLVTRLTYR